MILLLAPFAGLFNLQNMPSLKIEHSDLAYAFKSIRIDFGARMVDRLVPMTLNVLSGFYHAPLIR